jgi:hypothetical protein
VIGYLHPQYAASLSEFGEPMQLPKSGGWLLKRPVDGIRADAMGTYPPFACADWKSLQCDFNQLGRSLVSIVAVDGPVRRLRRDFASRLLWRPRNAV